MKELTLTNSLIKRFCKDFNLPINVHDPKYFDYFIELYDPLFNTKQKFTWLKEAIDKTGGIDQFFLHGKKFSDDVKSLISNTQAYKNMSEIDLNKIYPLKQEVSQQDIYVPSNLGRTLISVDLEKANFNSMSLFGLKEELGIQNYQELLQKATDLDYYMNSKMIRQVIFGDLNPKRQQRMQKYVINQLCEKLKEAGYQLSSASTDEIIIDSGVTVEQVKKVLENVDEKFKFFKVESFTLEKVTEDSSFYVKHIENGAKIEFRSVPSYLFAQVYKQYYGKELCDNDLTFSHDGTGILAKFNEPYFSRELTHNNKDTNQNNTLNKKNKM